MPAKSLVFVVGAGASEELGLPIGSKLKSEIADALYFPRDEFGSFKANGDSVVLSAIAMLASGGNLRPNPDLNKYLDAANRIHSAMRLASSIDHFVHEHRGNAELAQCAKLGIVRTILSAEQRSTLRSTIPSIQRPLEFKNVKQSWLDLFFIILREECRFEDLPARFEKVGIVCFNYDRCIEQFLRNAVQVYYGVPLAAADAALKSLSIYHPYGSLGPLPYGGNAASALEYGYESPTFDYLISASKSILTFSEGVNAASSEIQDIHGLMSTAARLVFLGFSFHDMNMRLLFSTRYSAPNPRHCRVYATGYGLSKADTRIVADQLNIYTGCQPDNIEIAHDTKCTQLLNEHRRSFSLVNA